MAVYPPDQVCTSTSAIGATTNWSQPSTQRMERRDPLKEGEKAHTISSWVGGKVAPHLTFRRRRLFCWCWWRRLTFCWGGLRGSTLSGSSTFCWGSISSLSSRGGSLSRSSFLSRRGCFCWRCLRGRCCFLLGSCLWGWFPFCLWCGWQTREEEMASFITGQGQWGKTTALLRSGGSSRVTDEYTWGWTHHRRTRHNEREWALRARGDDLQ